MKTVFNPIRLHNALMTGNATAINQAMPFSYELDAICARNVKTDAYFNARELFKIYGNEISDYAANYKTEVIDADMVYNQEVHDAIMETYGAFMAHEYAWKRGVDDGLQCMFENNCNQYKPYKKPCNNAFRDNANFIGGIRLLMPGPLASGLNTCREIITLNTYASKNGNRNYCALWVSIPEGTLAGFGQAGGYGYDRINGAINDALASIGLRPIRDYGSNLTTCEALAAYISNLYPDAPLIFQRVNG